MSLIDPEQFDQGESLLGSGFREKLNRNFDKCVTDVVAGDGVSVDRIGNTVIVNAVADNQAIGKEVDDLLYILTACQYDMDGNEQEPGTRLIQGGLQAFVGKVIQTAGDDRWWRVGVAETLVKVTGVLDECPPAPDSSADVSQSSQSGGSASDGFSSGEPGDSGSGDGPGDSGSGDGPGDSGSGDGPGDSGSGDPGDSDDPGDSGGGDPGDSMPSEDPDDSDDPDSDVSSADASSADQSSAKSSDSDQSSSDTREQRWLEVWEIGWDCETETWDGWSFGGFIVGPEGGYGMHKVQGGGSGCTYEIAYDTGIPADDEPPASEGSPPAVPGGAPDDCCESSEPSSDASSTPSSDPSSADPSEPSDSGDPSDSGEGSGDSGEGSGSGADSGSGSGGGDSGSGGGSGGDSEPSVPSMPSEPSEPSESSKSDSSKSGSSDSDPSDSDPSDSKPDSEPDSEPDPDPCIEITYVSDVVCNGDGTITVTRQTAQVRGCDMEGN